MASNLIMEVGLAAWRMLTRADRAPDCTGLVATIVALSSCCVLCRPQARRRRNFEDTQDIKKRKIRERGQRKK